MKSLYKSITIVACLATITPAFGSLTVTPLNSGPFYDLVEDMTNGKGDLLNSNGNGLEYSQFVWDLDDNHFIADRGQSSYPGGSGNYAHFQQVANFATLSDTELNIGYFGNESLAWNRFGFSSGGYQYYLNYDKEGGLFNILPDPPQAANFYDGGNAFNATFYHQRKQLLGGWTPKNYASDSDHFAIFEGVIDLHRTWIFMIEDVNSLQGCMNDYDDGLFVVQSGAIIPEPSTIGLLAVAGLLGFAYFRRRKKV